MKDIELMTILLQLLKIKINCQVLIV